MKPNDAEAASAPIPMSEARAEMIEMVMPAHSNILGKVFGGQLMAWMDMCAALAAIKHARRICVTAHVDRMSFRKPIPVGWVAHLKSQVNWTGRSSLEVGVRVEARNLVTGEVNHCTSAFFTMVAVDDQGHTVEVPPVTPVSEEDKRRFDRAARSQFERRQIRKAPEGA